MRGFFLNKALAAQTGGHVTVVWTCVSVSAVVRRNTHDVSRKSLEHVVKIVNETVVQTFKDILLSGLKISIQIFDAECFCTLNYRDICDRDI